MSRWVQAIKNSSYGSLSEKIIELENEKKNLIQNAKEDVRRMTRENKEKKERKKSELRLSRNQASLAHLKLEGTAMKLEETAQSLAHLKLEGTAESLVHPKLEETAESLAQLSQQQQVATDLPTS